jgi:isochorismate synthase
LVNKTRTFKIARLKIKDHIRKALEKELPFVAYRKPNSDTVVGFFQKSNTLYYSKKYEESGFIFAPFDDDSLSVLIPENDSEIVNERWSFQKGLDKKTAYESSLEAKEYHVDLVEKTIREIENTDARKIVISRKEELQTTDVDCLDIFLKLLNIYDAAMVYLWYHPKVGMWLGATPETLLKTNDCRFSTMSLAATRPYSDTLNILWNAKELEEQSLVTEFIVFQLTPVVESIKVHERETVQAGNVVHLKTMISGEYNNENYGLRTLLKALHPTPAVCGMPRKEAKEFILSREGYDRRFYTGFLGEINYNNFTDLFVNLRCMEVESKSLSLYVGGGITQESIPEKEWEETTLKTNTLKRVL